MSTLLHFADRSSFTNVCDNGRQQQVIDIRRRPGIVSPNKIKSEKTSTSNGRHLAKRSNVQSTDYQFGRPLCGQLLMTFNLLKRNDALIARTYGVPKVSKHPSPAAKNRRRYRITLSPIDRLLETTAAAINFSRCRPVGYQTATIKCRTTLSSARFFDRAGNRSSNL